jgi:hypothetical protein
LFTCNQLLLTGSLAVQDEPVTRWSWGANGWFGFANRTFLADTTGATPRLQANPPPLFPNDGIWELSRVRDGSADCVPGKANAEVVTCPQ